MRAGSVRRRPSCAPRFAETSFKADMIRRRVMMTTETAASGRVGLGRGGRMSHKRKRDAVLRLVRGEDLETLSRALGATAATLSGWQDTFVAAGEASLATRSTDGEALETLPPIIFPGRPERWWGDEALKAETDAP